MTFSSSEILEDFLDSIVCVHRSFASYGETDRGATDILHLEMPLYDTHKAADEFLKANDAERERLRNVPRVIPKDPFPRGAIGFTEAEQIRKINAPAAEIARRCKVGRYTITRILKGQTHMKPKTVKVTPAVRALILADRAAGMPGKAIAEKYGLSHSYAYSIIARKND